MSKKTRVKVPKRFLGTKIPKDLRKSLNSHIELLDQDGAKSLVAAVIASWVMSNTTDKPTAGITRH